ncbi:MAG: NirD/YgiW/YdeI family stress tolerance protein [Rhodocyclaceae bacterium]
MKTAFATLLVGAVVVGSTTAIAQYVGPNGSPQTVRQLLDQGRDHEPVVLRGTITRRTAYSDLYNFTDGTGSVLIKINDKHWPLGLKVDDKTPVEIVGKFDREYVGFTKVKVVNIRPVQ